MTQAQKRWLMLVILLGGVAVIASYIWGATSQPRAGEILWGGVPENIQPVYTVNMFLAAAGYFLFTSFILFRLEPAGAKTVSRFGYGVFHFLYAAILIPSALWLPLTFLADAQSSQAFLWMVRIVLGMVGLASLSLFATLLKLRPPQLSWHYWLAILGIAFFCLQTVILDAIVWVVFFQL